ncbi:DnaJ domain-containing protein [Besnoitia besnoiti]|uniref:DnaJ domain-containing protein n=1 Tax=Besnoitia besnoiti TaxID=94643 RepID=A0A2A9M8M8_BESBE|nr:DnaJ domain-containing protein [Besnoitia besnoiti]PFH32266.1 DnaJ domain-containing protein [Besnoitia besnoiti]
MAGGNAAARQTVCYYELLKVERTSSLDEIRKAFRRQALLLHPDKNADRVEEATREFQQLQEAYECLSDPQERAWYDAHREQILGGGGGGCKGGDEGLTSRGTSVDLWAFFSASCFSSFSAEDEDNFWQVYGDVFATLAKEETDELRANGVDKATLERAAAAPAFGDASAPWAEVSAFYAFWTGFSSSKSFAFADEWKISAADSRLQRRFLQKENEKLRRGKKKQFNEIVRKLAEAVKKRDPRVLKRSKELIEEKMKARQRQEEEEEKRKVLLAQQRREHRMAQEALWVALEEERRELKRQGYTFAGDSEDESEEDTDKQDSNEEEEGVDVEDCSPRRRGRRAESEEVSQTEEPEDDEAFLRWYERRQLREEAGEGASASSTPHAASREVRGAMARGEGGGWRRKAKSEEKERKLTVVVHTCEVCRKTFKSASQFEAHERSAKHQQRVKHLRMQAREEADDLEGAEDEGSPQKACGDNVSGAKAKKKGRRRRRGGSKSEQKEVEEAPEYSEPEETGEASEDVERHKGVAEAKACDGASSESDASAVRGRTLSSPNSDEATSEEEDDNESLLLRLAQSKRGVTRFTAHVSSSDSAEDESEDESELGAVESGGFGDGEMEPEADRGPRVRGKGLNEGGELEEGESPARRATLRPEDSKENESSKTRRKGRRRAGKAKEPENPRTKDSETDEAFVITAAGPSAAHSSSSQTKTGGKTASLSSSAPSSLSAPAADGARGKGREKEGKAKDGKHAETEWSCQICGAAFETRNKLFQHIKAEGHAALKVVEAGNSRGKKTRKARN